MCSQAGRHPIPGFWYCVADINHVLIVLNSSLNCYIYCLVGKRFRAELVLCVKKAARKAKFVAKKCVGYV